MKTTKIKVQKTSRAKIKKLKKEIKEKKIKQIKIKQLKIVKMNHRRKKGSLTLEAALLLPMLLMVLSMMIYLGFFVYNRCIIPQQNYITGMRGAYYEKAAAVPNQKETYMTEQKKELEGTKVLASYRDLFQIEQQGKEIVITEKNHMKVPFSLLLNHYGLKGYFQFEDQKKIREIQEVDFIRSIRKIKEVVK